MEPNPEQETSAVLPVSVATMFVPDLLLDVSFKQVHKQNCFELAEVPYYNILVNLYEVSGVSEQFRKHREASESPAGSLHR
jgi:hypothetical protein